MPSPIQLRQRKTNRIVQAELLDTAEIDFTTQQRQWEPWLQCYRKLGDQGDAAWDWAGLLQDERRQSAATQCFAIRAQGFYQGLMILGAAEGSNLTRRHGDRLLYVNYLASAPWNRADFRTRRKTLPPVALAGVGLALILYAIQMSEQQGLQGRLGLHALHDAIDFYVRKCHFTYLGTKVLLPDPPYPWLELPTVAAEYLVERA